MSKFIPPPGYGEPNFKPSRAERDKAKRTRKSAQQRREGNSEAHLAAIRRCPCVGCLTVHVKIDPHHLLGGPAGAERCFGRRATDQYAVPVCREDHEIAQRGGGRNEESIFKAWGIDDVYALAEALWQAPKDPAIMARIILAHKNVQK